MDNRYNYEHSNLSREDVEKAISNYKPKSPIRIELGGDYYFKCPWITCNSDISRYDNFCPQCGQRLLWDYYW